MYRIELESPTVATPSETLLLYALAEELLISKKWVDHYSRMNSDIVVIHVLAESREAALMRVFNALRCSKNYMAHICAVTVVD